MEMIHERIDFLNQVAFFNERKGLAQAIVYVEKKTGIKLPTEFKVTLMPSYKIGHNEVTLGRIHTYYFFGLEIHGIVNYQAFENKKTLKLFFTQMEGLEREDLAFWLREIDDIPVK